MMDQLMIWFFKSPAGKALILLLFLCGLAGYIFWPRHLGAPDEKNRVMHPEGYSIIAPLQWEARMDVKSGDAYAKDRMHLRPIREGLWQPEILIVRLAKPPDAAKLKETGHFQEANFQGAEALIFDQPVKKYWTDKADSDAVRLATAAEKAAADLRVAAGLQSMEGIDYSAKELTDYCAQCHKAHREQLPDGTFQIK